MDDFVRRGFVIVNPNDTIDEKVSSIIQQRGLSSTAARVLIAQKEYRTSSNARMPRVAIESIVNNLKNCVDYASMKMNSDKLSPIDKISLMRSLLKQPHTMFSGGIDCAKLFVQMNEDLINVYVQLAFKIISNFAREQWINLPEDSETKKLTLSLMTITSDTTGFETLKFYLNVSTACQALPPRPSDEVEVLTNQTSSMTVNQKQELIDILPNSMDEKAILVDLIINPNPMVPNPLIIDRDIITNKFKTKKVPTSRFLPYKLRKYEDIDQIFPAQLDDLTENVEWALEKQPGTTFEGLFKLINWQIHTLTPDMRLLSQLLDRLKERGIIWMDAKRDNIKLCSKDTDLKIDLWNRIGLINTRYDVDRPKSSIYVHLLQHASASPYHHNGASPNVHCSQTHDYRTVSDVFYSRCLDKMPHLHEPFTYYPSFTSVAHDSARSQLLVLLEQVVSFHSNPIILIGDFHPAVILFVTSLIRVKKMIVVSMSELNNSNFFPPRNNVEWFHSGSTYDEMKILKEIDIPNESHLYITNATLTTSGCERVRTIQQIIKPVTMCVHARITFESSDELGRNMISFYSAHYIAIPHMDPRCNEILAFIQNFALIEIDSNQLYNLTCSFQVRARPLMYPTVVYPGDYDQCYDCVTEMFILLSAHCLSSRPNNLIILTDIYNKKSDKFVEIRSSTDKFLFTPGDKTFTEYFSCLKKTIDRVIKNLTDKFGFEPSGSIPKLKTNLSQAINRKKVTPKDVLISSLTPGIHDYFKITPSATALPYLNMLHQKANIGPISLNVDIITDDSGLKKYVAIYSVMKMADTELIIDYKIKSDPQPNIRMAKDQIATVFTHGYESKISVKCDTKFPVVANAQYTHEFSVTGIGDVITSRATTKRMAEMMAYRLIYYRLATRLCSCLTVLPYKASNNINYSYGLKDPPNDDYCSFRTKEPTTDLSFNDSHDFKFRELIWPGDV